MSVRNEPSTDAEETDRLLGNEPEASIPLRSLNPSSQSHFDQMMAKIADRDDEDDSRDSATLARGSCPHGRLRRQDCGTCANGDQNPYAPQTMHNAAQSREPVTDTYASQQPMDSSVCGAIVGGGASAALDRAATCLAKPAVEDLSKFRDTVCNDCPTHIGHTCREGCPALCCGR